MRRFWPGNSSISASKWRRNGPEDALDWREGPDDDLVLALAIAAWEAERNPGLGFSYGYGVSELAGLEGLLALGETRVDHEAVAARHYAHEPPTPRDVGPRRALGRGRVNNPGLETSRHESRVRCGPTWLRPATN